MWETPNTLLSSEITLRALELLEVSLPQTEEFRSAVGVRKERRALLVRWWDQEDDWGIGECSCRPDPFFNGEFVDGAFLVIERYLFPLLPAKGTVQTVSAALSRIRDWNFTTAAVLDSALDLLRRKGRPDTLDLWPGEPLRQIPVGISLGLFDSTDAAIRRVQAVAQEGYRRVKLKISPDVSFRRLEEIRREFPKVQFGLDANGCFDRADIPFLASLAKLEPTAVEQPFPPSRLDLCSELKQQCRSLRICLDESIRGIGDLITAHQVDALDEINLKPGRVGGHLETLQILEYASDNDLPVWVGGMFETGIGRHSNLRYASRLLEATAHDLSPSARYFKSDLVKQPPTMTSSGHINLPDDTPVQLDEQNIERFLVRRIVLQVGEDWCVI